MHELSLVASIVNTCEKLVQQHNGKAVKEITLQVGTLSGVELDALQFAWEIGVQESVLAKSKCQIKTEQAKAKCQKCQQHFQPKTLYEACPSCGHYGTDYITGRAFKIDAVKIER